MANSGKWWGGSSSGDSCIVVSPTKPVDLETGLWIESSLTDKDILDIDISNFDTPINFNKLGNVTNKGTLSANKYNSVCIENNGIIYLFGGESAGGSSVSNRYICSNITTYDPNTGTVTELSTLPNCFGGGLGACVNNKVYLFGGKYTYSTPDSNGRARCYGYTSTYTNNYAITVYDLSTRTVSTLSDISSDILPIWSQNDALNFNYYIHVYNNKIYLIDKIVSYDHTNCIICFDPSTNTCTKIKDFSCNSNVSSSYSYYFRVYKYSDEVHYFIIRKYYSNNWSTADAYKYNFNDNSYSSSSLFGWSYTTTSSINFDIFNDPICDYNNRTIVFNGDTINSVCYFSDYINDHNGVNINLLKNQNTWKLGPYIYYNNKVYIFGSSYIAGTNTVDFPWNNSSYVNLGIKEITLNADNYYSYIKPYLSNRQTNDKIILFTRNCVNSNTVIQGPLYCAVNKNNNCLEYKQILGIFYCNNSTATKLNFYKVENNEIITFFDE